MEFERTARSKIRNLQLTPLIDVMFILIIFFMLTSTFMRIESLELMLPSAQSKAEGKKADVLHLFIRANGDMLLGQRNLDQGELTESLSRMFSKDPGTRIMLLTADGVTMQQLVNIMDRVYMAGGRSLFVRKWDSTVPSSPIVAKEGG
jgi:biopolymer transport protein ExbD